MSENVQSNDTLLYISNVGIYICFKYRVKKRKERRRERSKKERERERERQPNRYHTVDCHAKVRRRTITKKKRVLTKNEQRLLRTHLQILAHMFKRGMSKGYLLS